MRTFQQKVFAQLERLAEMFDLDLVNESTYANVGTLYMQQDWETVLTVQYDFQSGRWGGSKLLINGAQHGPPGPDNYFVLPTDTIRIYQFFDRVRKLCRDYFAGAVR